jgi:hypothetical protein
MSLVIATPWASASAHMHAYTERWNIPPEMIIG